MNNIEKRLINFAERSKVIPNEGNYNYCATNSVKLLREAANEISNLRGALLQISQTTGAASKRIAIQALNGIYEKDANNIMDKTNA